MTNTLRVLLVDGLSETETVLRAVFEPQGASVERRRGTDSRSCDLDPPSVVVVDGDESPSAVQALSSWPNVPRVVLGSSPVDDNHPQSRFLEKPFHYPELVRLVQGLLDLPTHHRRVA